MPGDRDLPLPRAAVEAFIEAPAQTRRLYPRGSLGDLEPNAIQVAVALLLHPDSTVGELARRLAFRPQTASGALRTLHELGFARELSDRDDARRRRQRLTAKGRRRVERFIASAAAELR